MRCDAYLSWDENATADEALRPLRAALARLPRSFLRAARVARLAVCYELDIVDPEVKEVAGTIERDTGTVFIGLWASPDPGSTVRHETYHLFDAATSMWGETRDDPEWEKLNAIGFRYTDAAVTTAPPILARGFTSIEGMTNIVEDKAYLFKAAGDGVAFCAQVASDPILLAKARLMRARIARAIPEADVVERSVAVAPELRAPQRCVPLVGCVLGRVQRWRRRRTTTDVALRPPRPLYRPARQRDPKFTVECVEPSIHRLDRGERVRGALYVLRR
jgi:hypothetical protein